ncbi:MAG TPA: M28 family peptidase [Bacillota bacterium]
MKAQAGSDAAREQAILEEISAERLMEYTRGIARWVRLSGTEDERRAVDYVRDLLGGFGLKTRVIEHLAYISLPGEASLEVITPEAATVECITHSMAASTPPGGLEGEVVFVGDAGAADLEGVDLNGKIALALGLAMPVKVRALEERGAAAQIHINDDQMHEMIVSTVWGSPTPETAGRLPHTPVVSVRGPDGERLVELARRGLRVRLTTRVDTGWRTIPLLLADLPAPQSDDFVLFSGHIDSWHYGAMDNGTANATMIEMARVLAPHRRHLRRGLRLAFWSGHSHGRYAGSAWYADNAWEELYERCVAHVNIDSVGGKGATILTEGLCMSEAKPLARAVIKELTGQEFEGKRASRAGDQSFWGLGIPAMFMSLSEQPAGAGQTEAAFSQLLGSASRSGGLGWWWHTPEDTIDKIDPEFLLRDARVYAAVLHRLLTDPVLPFDYAEHARELIEALAQLQQALGDRFDLSEPLRRARELERRATELNARAREVRGRAAGAGGAGAEGDAAADAAGDGDAATDGGAAVDAAGAADAAAQREAAALNHAIKRLGRLLIPLNYSQVGPYDHDPGISLPPIPALAPARELAQAEPGSDRARQLETRLVRARNYVNHTLARALRCVDEALGGAA